MRRVLSIAVRLEVWVLCLGAAAASSCVALPESPEEAPRGALAADADGAVAETLVLDGGVRRPATGAPYTGPQCGTTWSDAGRAAAGAPPGSAPGDGDGDLELPSAGDGAGEGGAGASASEMDGSVASAKPSPQRAGELVITELMVDPSARRDDVAEWIELWNATDAELDLSGCVIDDGGKALRMLPGFAIAPHGLVTIAHSADAGFAPDLLLPISLANTADNVAIACDGVEIDRVGYGAGFPLKAGASLSLDPGAWDAAENDRGDRWCSASVVFEGDRGSPGGPNESCFAIDDAGSDGGA